MDVHSLHTQAHISVQGQWPQSSNCFCTKRTDCPAPTKASKAGCLAAANATYECLITQESSPLLSCKRVTARLVFPWNPPQFPPAAATQ